MIRSPQQLMQLTEHRPFPPPSRPWMGYQLWRQVLFLHWHTDPALLAGLLPKGVEPDLYNGWAWVSLVLFSARETRLRFLPPIPGTADFEEVNLRTYVSRDGIPGICFLDILASKKLPTLLNRMVGLPYHQAFITREGGERARFLFRRHRHERAGQDCIGDLGYHKGGLIAEPAELDLWLTERYCAYQQRGRRLYRYHIHHAPWRLRQLQLRAARISYNHGNLRLSEPGLSLMHYAEGMGVLIWNREHI
jgi:uncharacterized protein YqjF (DUF2071 family)